MRWSRDAVVGGALVASVWAAACEEDPAAAASEGAPGADSGAATACASGVSYRSFAGPFFLSWCTGCHSSELGDGERQEAPLGVDFDSIDGIRGHAGRIERRVVTERTMPVAGGPSDTERELLAEWLACGMPAEDPFFDPPPPEHETVEGPPDTRTCAMVREALPATLLPRCAAATRTCVDACAVGATDDAAIEACRDACFAADPTPPGDYFGYPIDCSTCTLLQLLACSESVGCHDQVAGLMCCIEECQASGDPACAERECATAIDAFGQCVYYRGEHCLREDGPRGACYAAGP